MKRILHWIALSVVAMLLWGGPVACSDDPEVIIPQEKPQPEQEPVLTLTSQEVMNFEAEGGIGEISYSLQYPREGVYVLAGCEADWVTNLEGGDKVTFKVLANTAEEARTAKIKVQYASQSFEVTVNQAGQEPENPEEPEDPEDPKEPEDPEEPEDPKEPEVVTTWRVVATIGGGTRVSFTEELTAPLWSGGELLKAYAIDSEGNFRVNNAGIYDESEPLAAGGGHEATFTGFDALPIGGSVWFSVGSNIHEYSDAHKYEFLFPSLQQQSRAGEIEGAMLPLVSDRVEVITAEPAEGETAVEVELRAEMRSVGTLLRFVPFTPSGLYAAEQVLSVMLHAEQVISGPAAAMAYNFAEFYTTTPGYQYWQSNNEGDYGPKGALIWDNVSTSVTTTLTEPMPLEGVTSATDGKGIYMSVAPVEAGKCSYVVTTDAAIYTFEAGESVAFGEGVLGTVVLDLESAKRIGHDDVRGDLRYEGSLADFSVSHNAAQGGIGYWYAQTRDLEVENWVTREGNESDFYLDVKFEIIDNATGAQADWLTVAYRANDTWWDYIVSENSASEPRSATITATFADVNGYLVTDACRTKTIQFTQAAYSSTQTLSFGGGVGDQIISGKAVTNHDLGWCVIAVNNVYAEDWAGDSHNEQALYGGVEIVCREGSDVGPEVDWLTVAYGKNPEGLHNSTHLYATATENTTGADRRALVCCYYHAPEGYQFEDGSTTAFRQFFVTQRSSSSLQPIEFWGSVGDIEHNASAQQAWGLGYWVIRVDGMDATDWNGDSHNEQMLYGAAEFTCYDYTSGQRGEPVEWVKVDYKYENGGYIDTWWLADIEANATGAVRKAEVVCTFPKLTGYSYPDGAESYTKSIIITQLAE